MTPKSVLIPLGMSVLCATSAQAVCLNDGEVAQLMQNYVAMGGVRGPATDIDIEAREIVKMRARLNHLFARETGQPYEKVCKDTDRNYWMSAEEAIAYGLVTRVIDKISDLH